MSSQSLKSKPAVPGNAPLSRLLTPAELAKTFNVKESYLDWLRRRHGLSYVRIGGEVRFDVDAVNAWLQGRAKGGRA